MADGVAGVYIHVPFCLKKCRYCAFHSVKMPEDVSGMCAALKIESVRRIHGSGYSFRTFYAGGGTPSLLPSELWRSLVGTAGRETLSEVTMETNPAVLDEEGYRSLLRAGFNRVSIGVQSFNDAHLRILGRIHSAEDAGKALRLAAKAGFGNISMDLMFGLPEQTLEDQRRDLEAALRYMPQHLSLYELSLEPGTPMGALGIKGSEEMCVDMYYLAHEFLTSNGYVHYEVSSYALGEEFRSLHNTSYWNRVPYIGIGPSAHSFTGRVRSWNKKNNDAYVSALLAGDSPEEGRETLSPENEAYEILALGFRNTHGVDIGLLNKIGFDLDPSEFVESGFVSLHGSVLVPDERGMLLADFLSLKAAELLKKA